MISAKKTKVNILKHGLKMVFLGGMAIVIGIIVGKFLRIK
jgi:VIT1/CCC1 family predicted Fe2+/Mn2+ transporter